MAGNTALIRWLAEKEKSLRVLLITQWFDPEPTAKGRLFAESIAGLGHDVTVLTGFPNYPSGRVYDGYQLRPCQVTRLGNISVIRVWLYPSHDTSAVRRVLNYVSFAITSSVSTLLAGRFDVAYVYHPPGTIGLAALVLRCFRDTPFVYDIQDLWPDSLRATGMVRAESLLTLVGCWMGMVYRKAAFVVAQSPGFAAVLSRRGVAPSRLRVIYNWALEDRGDLGGSANSSVSPMFTSDAFNVVFAGNVGRAQQLQVVADAARILKARGSKAVFHIVGDGVDLPRLEEMIQERGTTNVVLHGRRHPSQMPEILASADALLVHLRDDPLFRVTIPSKTQAYLLAGRPILIGVCGDAADLVLRAGAGLNFRPGDALSLADAVGQLETTDKIELQLMGRRGRAFYERELSMAVGVGEFDEVLHEAVAKHAQYQSGFDSWPYKLASAFVLANLAGRALKRSSHGRVHAR